MENLVNIRYKNLNFFSGKKIFITGHTGFKGSWLTFLLSKLGAEICGYSLNPITEPSLYEEIKNHVIHQSIIGDINDKENLESAIVNFQPDFIFHLAAQPLVRESYINPIGTISTNILGTANLINSLLKIEKKCTSILITTDKVYRNNEWHYPYRETDTLGGYDPYSASKAASELIIDSFRNSFFNLNEYSSHLKSFASVRAGNVIGGGDWSNDRLIPDIVKSLVRQENITIRNPNSIRPWQHVLEPLFGYLELAIELSKFPEKFSGSWNFGPEYLDNLSVETLVKDSIEVWGEGSYIIQSDIKAPHEAGTLKLDINKVMTCLNWKPRFNAKESIHTTMNWYKKYYQSIDSIVLMESDLNLFLNKE